MFIKRKYLKSVTKYLKTVTVRSRKRQRSHSKERKELIKIRVEINETIEEQ